jgi:hypothetical protein
MNACEFKAIIRLLVSGSECVMHEYTTVASSTLGSSCKLLSDDDVITVGSVRRVASGMTLRTRHTLSSMLCNLLDLRRLQMYVQYS